MADVLAADSDRERAAAALREHYVRGRLTLDELSGRLDRVLDARSRAELRVALSGLPMVPEARELAGEWRSLARAAARVVVLALCTGVYVVFTLVLLVVFGLTLLLQGASSSALLAFLVVWLVPTYLLSRVWHGGREAR
jgi:putative copper export protein